MAKHREPGYGTLEEIGITYNFKGKLVGEIIDSANGRTDIVKPTTEMLTCRVAVHKAAYLWHIDTIRRLIDLVIEQALQGAALSPDKESSLLREQKSTIKKYAKKTDLTSALEHILKQHPIPGATKQTAAPSPAAHNGKQQKPYDVMRSKRSKVSAPITPISSDTPPHTIGDTAKR